jgi:hypothetical protein
MKKDKSIQLGLVTTIVSFIIGSIIFGLYYFTSFAGILFLGYFFIVVAGLINIIVFAKMTSNAAKEKDKKIFRVSALMLINIPIMLLYRNTIIEYS